MDEAQTNLEWYRSPIERSKLVELTKRRNLRPLLDNLLQISISIATGVLSLYAFRNWNWPWIVAITYIHCSFYGIYGSAGQHELSHRTVFASRRLNEFFLGFHAFLNWYDCIFFRRSHASHHLHTVHNDLDMEVMLPTKFGRREWIWSLLINLPIVIRLFRTYFRRAFRSRDNMFANDWERQRMKSDDGRLIREMRRWLRFLIFGHAALAVLFVVSGNWYLMLLVSFGPFIAMWFKMMTHMPQHLGLRPSVADWRESTRTYIGGPVSRFLYWNMNYHLEHHMYAAVPYYNLPKLRKEIEWDLPIATKSLLATWREVNKALEKQTTDKSYYLIPELPEGATPFRQTARHAESNATA